MHEKCHKKQQQQVLLHKLQAKKNEVENMKLVVEFVIAQRFL